MTDQKGFRRAGFAIFLFGLLFMEGLEFLLRPRAVDGLYFQAWSSETLMQTVSIQDLRTAPLVSLYYIHIQPPGLDALRALLVALWPSLAIHDALRNVDSALYFLWAVLFALMGYLVYRWLAALMGMAPAIIGSILFLLHPATILYASLLDTTFLSALLILWMMYLLWSIKNGRQVSIVLFAVVVLLLFFFRSNFQLPTILLFLISLWLLRVPARKLLVFTLIVGGIAGVYVAKQYYLFHSFSTSSFAGQNLMWSIGLSRPDYKTYLANPANLQSPEAGLPDVLTRLDKITGDPNFNNINYLRLNQQLLGEYLHAVRATPAGVLAAAYIENARIYFLPSSAYTGNVLVDPLPWRALYDAIFSYPVLVVLLFLAALQSVWNMIRARAFASSLALLLPALYVFLTSILGERAENMRYKYFLEPVMYVFLVTQFYLLARWLRKKLFTRAAAPAPVGD